PGERERNDDDADEGELTPLAYRAFAGLHDQASVAEQSADRRIVDDAHGPRRKPHHLAVVGDLNLWNARRTRKLRMRFEMARFAVHGDGDPRTCPGVELL